MGGRLRADATMARAWFSAADLVELLEKAAQLILAGFAIPIAAPEENLSIFGRIVLEVAQRSQTSWDGLRGFVQASGKTNRYRMESNWACMSTTSKLSDIVYEYPHSRNCHLDQELLRQVKNASGLREM